MYYLGVSPCHDSSVCLLKDNKIELFLKEERLSKIKRDWRPLMAINKIFNDGYDPDYFVYTPVTESAWDQFTGDWKEISEKYFKKSKFVNELIEEHHLVHASLAFYNSGFDDAAVIVVDGGGGMTFNIQEIETIFFASYPNNFIPLYKSFHNRNDQAANFPLLKQKFNKNYPECEIDYEGIGIVSMYNSATNLIHQPPLESGKTMGLAAYGKNSGLPKITINKTNLMNKKYFVSDQEGTYRYIDYLLLESDITDKNYELYANYAYHVQKESEEGLEFLIRKAIEKTNSKNICITGGYGMNVVANLKFLKLFPGINFYFEPMADDSGNSIGAAMYWYREQTKDMSINKIKNTFFHGEHYKIPTENTQDVSVLDIAKMIEDDNCIAMYYGLAEAGPRALGHRSIIFDARNPNAKDLVNIIKKREWYRPFAAACLEEDAQKYFYLYDNNGYDFMTVNADAKEIAAHEIPGVLHVDGTCRIQIIKDSDEPLFKLLTEFKKLTGIGVVLNTSFNLAGEPLVETPEDATSTYNRSDLYCLWFPEINKALIKN